MHRFLTGVIARHTVSAFLLCLVAAPAFAQNWIYLAKPGDNLWNLAEEYFVDGARLTNRFQRLNKIAEPTRIPPGTRIRFPVKWLKQQPAAARLVRSTGTVNLFVASNTAAKPGVQGATLHVGVRLETGVDSAATVQFADGSRMLVQAGSDLSFDAMSAYHTTGMVDTTLRLNRGRVENEVKKAVGPGSRFRINTPAAVAAVRGTSFRIGYRAEDDTMLSEVSGGEVGVSGQDVTRRLSAGFGLLAKAGVPPELPRALLPAPDLSAVPARAERLLLEFEWPAIAGAVGYRGQLYAASDLQIVILDKTLSKPRVEWNAPPEGEYVFRVRAIDSHGLEGLSANHAFVLDARPVPPPQLKPEAAGKIHGPQQQFWWSKPEDAASYHLQIARDEAFSDRVVDSEGLTEIKHTLPTALVPGSYWWRLALVDGKGDKGPFGDPRALRVLAVPATPGAGKSSVGEDGVLLSWGRAADAAGYEFQLARDAEFTDLVHEEQLQETQYKLGKDETGAFFFRARGVSDEDVRGPWSPVNEFEIEAPPWDPLMILLLVPLLLL